MRTITSAHAADKDRAVGYFEIEVKMVNRERSIFVISNHLNGRLIFEIIKTKNTYVRVIKEAAKLVVIEGEILVVTNHMPSFTVLNRRTRLEQVCCEINTLI